jgi:hypothetical protein
VEPRRADKQWGQHCNGAKPRFEIKVAKVSRSFVREPDAASYDAKYDDTKSKREPCFGRISQQNGWSRRQGEERTHLRSQKLPDASWLVIQIGGLVPNGIH